MPLTDPAHPVFNPIVGRYTNRIKNGTLSIPITRFPQPPGPNVYQVPCDGQDGGCPPQITAQVYTKLIPRKDHATLHGSIYGWDRRNWTITAKSAMSVTYMYFDAADEGFPTNVTAHVRSNIVILTTLANSLPACGFQATHSVENRGILHTTVHATTT